MSELKKTTETTETAETTSATFEVEELGPCKRKLTVQVPKETIQAEVSRTFDELATTAVVPGFRRGHAPRRLLRTHFGEAVQEQVKERLISRSYREALQEHELEPVGSPDVSDVEFDPEKELRYEVLLEIKPVFEVEGYEGLELDRPPTQPTEEEVAEALEQLRQREARYEAVEGAAFGEDRLAVVDCRVTIDGKPYIDREQVELLAGPHNWLRLVSEEVEGSLSGKTSGEEVTFSTVIRPDFSEEAHRGKVAEVTVKFYEVKERRVPEADDEFAKSLGAEDLADLQERIRTELARQKEAEAEAALRQQVRDQLLERFDFELPEGLLREHTQEVLSRQRLQLQYRGVPLEELDKHTEELTEASQQQAQRDFKLHFILEKIAEREKVFATEHDLENEIARLAANYRVRPARMRAELESRRMLGELRSTLRERKTVDWLLTKAQVKEAGPAAASEAAAEGAPGEPQESDEAAEPTEAAEPGAPQQPAEETPDRAGDPGQE